MQLGPRQHESDLASVEVAVDDLDLVDPDLRFVAGVARVEMRVSVIVKEHRDHDPVEATDRRHGG